MKRFLALPMIAIVLVACERTTPEQRIVDDMAAALGGADRVLAVGTLVLEGEGIQYYLGQDVRPETSQVTFTVTDYRRAMSFPSGSARVELTRRPNFAYYRGRAPETQVEGLDGAVGYNIGANGRAVRISEAAALDRLTEWSQYPLTAVRAALDPATVLRNARTEGPQSFIDVMAADGREFVLALDNGTGLPSGVSSRMYHPNLGDIVLSTSFSDYQGVDGLNLPATLTTRVDDFTTVRISVTMQTVDGEPGDLSAPASVAAATPPLERVPEVVALPLADGITHLKGGSHHSVLVEFEDHLMLIEAPQSEARTAAVIAKARELVPGKPLTQLVNTHHHFDHSVGVRAAIAEGMTVITHEGNVAFLEEMARRPHALHPDALQRSGAKATIEGVDAERTLSDDTMSVTLSALSSDHSETMLIAYFPDERIVVQADQYTPATPIQMYAASFLAELQSRELDVDMVVPLHGDAVPYSQLVREVAEKQLLPGDSADSG